MFAHRFPALVTVARVSAIRKHQEASQVLIIFITGLIICAASGALAARETLREGRKQRGAR